MFLKDPSQVQARDAEGSHHTQGRKEGWERAERRWHADIHEYTPSTELWGRVVVPIYTLRKQLRNMTVNTRIKKQNKQTKTTAQPLA